MSIPEPGIPVAEIVSALSFALDLTEDAVPGHALRSCLLGMRLAHALGLSEEDRSSLFYALLLKDIGCSSNAARLCQIMGSDERLVKGAVKFEDWTHPTFSGMRMAWRYLWPNAGPLTRLSRLVGLGLHQQSNNEEMITLRCERGASIVGSIGLSPLTAKAIRHLDEHWNGSGYPGRLTGHEIPLLSRILLVAQHLDVFRAGRSAEAALASLDERSGRWFDPELVRLAHMLHHQGSLWSDLENRNVRAAVLDLEPGQRLVASSGQVDQICGAFADVVDVKSSFTGQHSRRVTNAALMMADTLGFSPERRTFIARAALLHDLGKLRVPNSILDKSGRLTAEEWAVVREHPLLTHQILGRVELFSELATVAGQHHEKLDGSGYPHGLTGADLSRESRLVAVADVYSALAEDRPYRPGLALGEIRTLMDKDAGTKLDGACYDALIASLEHLEPESRAVA
jgi:HD-GYP domain-containing protein (c-di-GMP phosphodiesterase class II)